MDARAEQRLTHLLQQIPLVPVVCKQRTFAALTLLQSTLRRSQLVGVPLPSIGTEELVATSLYIGLSSASIPVRRGGKQGSRQHSQFFRFSAKDVSDLCSIPSASFSYWKSLLVDDSVSSTPLKVPSVEEIDDWCTEQLERDSKRRERFVSNKRRYINAPSEEKEPTTKKEREA